MARLNAANNAETVLSQAVAVDDLVITVEDASVFPTAPFKLTIENEILEVTEVVGNTFTVLRGQEGTVASAYNVGAKVKNLFTAGSHNELVSEEEFMSHKAETTTNAHLAKNIGLEDVEGNFQSTELEGALSELFTNVSNGKNTIATAITDKGVSASGSDAFEVLASKIGQISTGKRWASGTTLSSSDRQSFYDWPNNTIVSSYYLEVTNLGVNAPYIIVITPDGLVTTRVPNTLYAWGTSDATIKANNIVFRTLYNVNLQNGFKIPIAANGASQSCKWIVFE